METIVLERVVPSVFAADPKAVEGSEIWLREVTFRRGVRYLVEAASGRRQELAVQLPLWHPRRLRGDDTLRCDGQPEPLGSGDGAISGAARWDC
ncbi:hypothetical protein LEA_01238, partial [human gut metagenome]